MAQKIFKANKLSKFRLFLHLITIAPFSQVLYAPHLPRKLGEKTHELSRERASEIARCDNCVFLPICRRVEFRGAEEKTLAKKSMVKEVRGRPRGCGAEGETGIG